MNELVINITRVVHIVTGLVLNMTGCFPNMSKLVLNMYGCVLNMTEFDLYMTVFTLMQRTKPLSFICHLG